MASLAYLCCVVFNKLRMQAINRRQGDTSSICFRDARVPQLPSVSIGTSIGNDSFANFVLDTSEIGSTSLNLFRWQRTEWYFNIKVLHPTTSTSRPIATRDISVITTDHTIHARSFIKSACIWRSSSILSFWARMFTRAFSTIFVLIGFRVQGCKSSRLQETRRTAHGAMQIHEGGVH
jgi:hypothetical protein